MLDLAAPYLEVADLGDTRAELRKAVDNAVRGLTRSPYGAVMRALLSQIAINPALGDAFRETVVDSRRNEIARVVERGIERGDLRPDTDRGIATELLIGPVYYRLVFGGTLDGRFSRRVVDAYLRGFSTRPATSAEVRASVDRRAGGVRGFQAASHPGR